MAMVSRHANALNWLRRIATNSILLFFFSISAAVGEEALQTIRLQLKWTHQFQFAGFYMALEKGFYRDAGFNVVILEGGPLLEPAQTVLSGKAEFGVGNSGLVLWRAKGAPVVAVAVIFQHSPFVLVARRGDDLRSVHDLVGRKVMMEEHSAELTAYLRMERTPIEKIKIIPHTGDVGALLRGDVDAISAYTPAEPYDLRVAGFPYWVFDPRSAGIDFYGDTLFTTQEFAAAAPETVKAFRDASMRGWRYAFDHLDETLDVASRYAPTIPRAKLEFEAEEVRRLTLVDMVEPGYMYPGRWRHIAEGFAAAGLIPNGVSLDGFLFDYEDKIDLTWFYAGLAAAVTITVVCGWFAARFAGLNGALRQEIDGRRLLEYELRRLAATDPLTGLHNRRCFYDLLEREIERSHRNRRPLTLLMADIDHFKRINDAHGHAEGDKALIRFAEICVRHLRAGDAAARIGGEEFAVILPDTDMDGAMHAAERIRQETANNVPIGVPAFTVSFGMADLRPEEDQTSLFARADEALYRAKAHGRNRTEKAEKPAL